MPQHPVRFAQGLVDMGYVPDPEDDGVGIELAIERVKKAREALTAKYVKG